MFKFIEYIPNYYSGFEPKTFSFNNNKELENKLNKLNLIPKDWFISMEYSPEICNQARIYVENGKDGYLIGFFEDTKGIYIKTFNEKQNFGRKYFYIINEFLRQSLDHILDYHKIFSENYCLKKENKKLRLEKENLYIQFGDERQQKQIALNRGNNYFG